jgi:hypothetical protein
MCLHRMPALFRFKQFGFPYILNSDNLILFDQDGNPITMARKGLDNTQLPTTKPLFSPRFGFNWDVNGNKTFQVREVRAIHRTLPLCMV